MESPRPRVLVIEDEFLIATMIAGELEDCGCEPLGPVGSVDEALSVCASVAADAVILDLVLRDRDAYSVAELLSERGIPFGLVTGSDRAALSERWQDVLCLEKPFTDDEFRKFLRTLLDGRVG